MFHNFNGIDVVCDNEETTMVAQGVGDLFCCGADID